MSKHKQLRMRRVQSQPHFMDRVLEGSADVEDELDLEPEQPTSALAGPIAMHPLRTPPPIRTWPNRDAAFLIGSAAAADRTASAGPIASRPSSRLSHVTFDGSPAPYFPSADPAIIIEDLLASKKRIRVSNSWSGNRTGADGPALDPEKPFLQIKTAMTEARSPGRLSVASAARSGAYWSRDLTADTDSVRSFSFRNHLHIVQKLTLFPIVSRSECMGA